MGKVTLLFFILCGFISVLYSIGLLFFIADRQDNDKCEMTYMFEYPQYVRITQEVDKLYPKYGLYSYAEGRMTKRARNMQFDGIPVLFIPGNAGSYQQVRSLSSVALRKFLNSGTNYHFDYFTMDTNSEFSALYGPTLYDQLTYATKSIERILQLYKNNPGGLVLIGHSVGGVVARRVISNLKSSKTVAILITLASPVLRAPIPLDRFMSSFYVPTDVSNITSINIAGGYSDMLVPSYLTVQKDSLNLVSTNIAKAWIESDHVQILWCKQIVLAINRALFDSVDLETRQISTDPAHIRKSFEHHLIHNSGTKMRGETKIDYKGDWIENIQKQYSVELKSVKTTKFYMVSFTMMKPYEILTALAINLEVSDWVYACSASYPNKASRVCVNGLHLSNYSEIAPTSRYKRRFFHINMHELHKLHPTFTHVVFKVLPTSEPISLHVDNYGANDRTQQIKLPISFNKQFLMETPKDAVMFNVVLTNLYDPLQIYQLFVEPQCSANTHHASATLIVPWANESVHSYYTESIGKPTLLRVQNPKPAGAAPAYVRLILDPACTYRISVKSHFVGIFGQIARYYSTFLISTLAVVFLLTFQAQLKAIEQNRRVPIIFASLSASLKEIFIIPATFLISLLLANWLPKTEIVISENPGYSGLAMLVLIMVSYGALFILVAALALSLFTLESTVHKLVFRLLARSVPLTFRFSDYFISFLQNVPFLVAAILIFLCFSACGSLALIVGLVFYFLKLTQMSQDCVEQVGWYIIKKIAKKLKKYFSKKPPAIEVNSTGITDAKKREETLWKDLGDSNDAMFFHFSIFLIWLFVAVLNLPAVLTWAHDFRYSKQLSPDESLIPGLIFSLGGLCLWQLNLPRIDREYFNYLRWAALSFIPIVFLYTPVSIYRLNYLLTLLFVLIIVQQIWPIKLTTAKSDKYDEVKAKMD